MDQDMSEAVSGTPNPDNTRLTYTNLTSDRRTEVPVVRDEGFVRLNPNVVSVWQDPGPVIQYDIMLLKAEARELLHLFAGMEEFPAKEGTDHPRLVEKKVVYEAREIGRVSIALPVALSLYTQLQQFFSALPDDAFARVKLTRPQPHDAPASGAGHPGALNVAAEVTRGP